MSSNIDKLAKNLYKTISESEDKKPKPADDQAVVTKIDGDIVWVKIPGGINETPVRKTVSAKPGDTVQVRRAAGRAWITGNATNPPTDDTRANQAYTLGSTAVDAANQAMKEAARAQVAADYAEAEAGRAKDAADSAQISADNAMVKLSVIEDVAGTVDWISKHGRYISTTDHTIREGVVYFEYSGGDYIPIVNPDPESDPAALGWYVLDITKSQTDYVMSHIAVTSAGLWILPNGIGSAASERYGPGYKILLSSDANHPGMTVYDANGNQVTYYGNNGVSFDSNRGFSIGDSNAYIQFDGNGHITIGGSGVTFGGSKTIEDVVDALDNTLIYDHTYTYDRDSNNKPIRANFEAFLYRSGVDIKTSKDPQNFTWYIKTEEGEVPLIPEGRQNNYGYTTFVDLESCGYGAEIVGKYTEIDNADALTNDGDTLSDAQNQTITVRSTGDKVRVRDLTVSSVIFPSDQIMIIGSEDEHLVSVQTLQDYLNVNLDKQVLFNTTAGWSEQITLVSKANTLYVYTDHQWDSQGNPIAGIKAGDGNAYVVDLPFTDVIATEHIADNTRHITAGERTAWNGHIANNNVHITSDERTAWNNKVRCYYAGTENLIFTTT